MAGSGVRRAVRRLGFDVARYPIHSTLHGHVRDLVSSTSVSVVLDVGANSGQFALDLRSELRYRGRIVSFEPFLPSFQECERRAAGDSLWTVRNLALGDVEGEMTLHAFSESNWNSLHGLDVEAVRRSGREIRAVGEVSCRQRRLDALWNELVRADDVVMLKSDTQGHELQVMAGAGVHLERVSVILIEVSLVAFYRSEPVLTDVLPWLAERGFSPSGFFPVTRVRNSQALTTLDVSFVRA